MRKLKYLPVALLVLFAAAQLIRPDRTNPPVNPASALQAAPPVQAIFDRSCRDCHSDRTVWPWYSQVAPVSWLVADDVKEGRGELNFSRWSEYPRDRARRKLSKICEEVRGGDMPLWYYTPMHAGTKLSAAERDAVCQWTQAELARQP